MKYVSYVEAVHAYARGLTVWYESDGHLIAGFCWDIPPAGFADPEERSRAARAGAHILRNVLRREDQQARFFLS